MRRKVLFFTLAALGLAGVFWLVNRAVYCLRLDHWNVLTGFDHVWPSILAKPVWISPNGIDLGLGFLAALFMFLLLDGALLSKGRWRRGEEYGSARWGTAKDIKPYIDPSFFNNVLLTKTERITMLSRPKNPETARNKNVLVLGGSGSGKTRFFVKPNLLQCHSSYVVTDPKGQLLYECGAALEANGYEVRILNVSGAAGMGRSMHYNPLAYLRSEADILKLIEALIANTTAKGERSAEKFWTDSEKLLYQSLIGYLLQEAPAHERNFSMLLTLLNASQASEEDEAFQSPVDALFAELEARDPDCFAVRQYKKFKLASAKTAKSILISCAARLAPFDIAEVRELTEYDELALDTLGDKRCALFVITSDTNTAFNFLAALMYSQLFNLLCDRADSPECGGRLPVHVRFLLDEFANIGKIPDFDVLISTIRSREISASIILQSKAQLEAVYEKKANVIADNCDTLLYLGGGRGKETLDELVKLLGKETIHQQTQGLSRGREKSSSTNTQQLGRELMTADELASMPRGKCICHISGLRPFYSDKYDLLKHPRYKLLSDADKANTYDVDRALGALSLSPDEEFIYFDASQGTAPQQT